MHAALAAFEGRVRGTLRADVPLSAYTTYRIGGPARAVLEPADAEDVVAAVGAAREHGMAWVVLGLGSNVLVADAGFDGLVVRMGKGVAQVVLGGPDETEWRVGAGVPTPHLARRSAARGLGGVHRLVGVPGTVGGGVYMNAGAHGQDFGSAVREVTVLAPTGAVETWRGEIIPWQYRDSGLGQAVVLETVLALIPGDPRRLEAEISEHFQWRKAGTPFNEACCGSVFRNPDVSSGVAGEVERPTAGRLIDGAGMKGFRAGGAQVSLVHANYIVNTGQATAADVCRVIDAVRDAVAREFGVVLTPELKFLGDFGDALPAAAIAEKGGP
ncbi:MAG TPA: UDP-N-acetylmuramate dehydrogenase [Gemmatimonadales bacterium]